MKIKKGLNINLKGKAAEVMAGTVKSDRYAIVPDHYIGITPKVMVKAGDRVKAGTTLMTDKYFPQLRFVSPVSGEVTAVNRGEKRKVLSIEVKPDDEIVYEKFDIKPDLSSMMYEEIRDIVLQAGMWPFIKQRPYDRVAIPTIEPNHIFVSAYNTAPLAPSAEFIVKGEEDAFRKGLEVLFQLAVGELYVGVRKGSPIQVTSSCIRVEIEGPHPAGNPGVLINHTRPVDKGETLWTLSATEVLYLGRLFLHGIADFSRTVALTGPEMTDPCYVKTIAGCSIQSLIEGKITPGDKHIRLISGNVLTGTKIEPSDYLGAYDNQITAIPEGDDVDEFLGWAMPGFGKYSFSRTYFTRLAGKLKEYVIDARIRGGRRAMIMSNEYDKVFPMKDILPEYLLKAIIAFDIEKMEKLGIYEVAPEDFALCEFVDTSKIELQKIVRNGLDLLYKEMN
jgi:Na+-transporting NADH:ubiquinone oxidoreductase subunit A